MASRQYNATNHQRSRAPSAASNATTHTAASTASTSIPMPTASNNAAAAVTSTTAATSQTGAAASIRRNLFHHHLSRRPVSASASSTATTTTATINNGPVGGYNQASKAASTSASASAAAAAAAAAAVAADNSDIVVRDKNGGYRIDVPILPPGIIGDDENDGGLEGIDGAEGDGKMSGREKEKIEASLVEMMYRSRNRPMSSEPSEILTLIHQSLRNRVAELDEDRWMYEVEEEVKA